MFRILLAGFGLCLGTVLLAQGDQGSILVICPAIGTVHVDGVEIGSTLPNKPLVHQVSAGDHFVQFTCSLTGRTEVLSEMVHVDSGKQKAVQFAMPTLLASTGRADTVNVADLNFAIPGGLVVGAWLSDHKGEEYPYPTYYYAFEKGDIVVLDVTMSNAKGTNGIEVSTYPDGIERFSDRAFAALRNRTFKVDERCILRIKLTTNHTFDRNGFMRVRRIPASAETRGFRTDVLWRAKHDTTYVLQEERYLVKSDTTIVNPIDALVKVSSQTNTNNPNRTLVEFDLPHGTVGWSYFVGVGQEGREAFSQARESFISGSEGALALLVGGGPLVPLALGGLNYFSAIQGPDNVHCHFMDRDNMVLFNQGSAYLVYKQSNVVSEAARMTSPMSGRIYLGLVNDNVMEGIEVTVKVTAVVVDQQFGTRTVREPVVKEVKEAYTLNP